MGGVIVISLVTDFGVLVEGGSKRGEWVEEEVFSCSVLWPLYVFGCISVVVVEGTCVKHCRWLGLYIVDIASSSVGGEYVGGSHSVMTGWGRIGGVVGYGGKSE
jgi:hypothetical protein